MSNPIASDEQILVSALKAFLDTPLEWQIYGDDLWGATPISDWHQLGFEVELHEPGYEDKIAAKAKDLSRAMADALRLLRRMPFARKPPSVQFGKLATRGARCLVRELNHNRMRMYVMRDVIGPRTLARFDIRVRSVHP